MDAKKLKCKTCENVWISYYEDTNVCEENNEHVVIRVPMTADDYANAWGEDFENENRHSLTSMPNEILSILSKEIKDEKMLLRIMRKLYKQRIGL